MAFDLGEFSLSDLMLDSPTAEDSDTGSTPRSETLSWDSAFGSVVDKMLEAGTAAVAGVFRQTDVGKRVEAEATRQAVADWLTNPMVLLTGVLVFLFAGMFLARR